MPSGGLNMMRATMGPMTVKIKNDPTGYEATLSRGLPQGAPSSPVYFNIYIDDIMEIEKGG